MLSVPKIYITESCRARWTLKGYKWIYRVPSSQIPSTILPSKSESPTFPSQHPAFYSGWSENSKCDSSVVRRRRHRRRCLMYSPSSKSSSTDCLAPESFKFNDFLAESIHVQLSHCCPDRASKGVYFDFVHVPYTALGVFIAGDPLTHRLFALRLDEHRTARHVWLLAFLWVT